MEVLILFHLTKPAPKRSIFPFKVTLDFLPSARLRKEKTDGSEQLGNENMKSSQDILNTLDQMKDCIVGEPLNHKILKNKTIILEDYKALLKAFDQNEDHTTKSESQPTNQNTLWKIFQDYVS
ncbi:MAG TPA: hypothetical protein PLS50_07045 [Candidatus Dojkabacteria bacterium]|nr:hypothetical protein [Candidatus Dojkabacteria bacterium]